ncbi:Ig-like domain-containing protein [Candidatus Giovannonibacteria bacterium]|nr:Ig-like domain-containing protein [Candidatus Giovannonibacteria bacterium]
MRVLHKKLLILIAGVLLLIYGVWQARDFLRGPMVRLDNPSNGQIFENDFIEVNGNARDVSKFTLNGRTVFTDEKGDFKEKILIAKGVNDIEIYAEDKFGHEKKILRTVLLK